jgi:hypothetical protein
VGLRRFGQTLHHEIEALPPGLDEVPHLVGEDEHDDEDESGTSA